MTDLVSTPSRFFRTNRFLRKRTILPTPDEVLMEGIQCARAGAYDWVIVGNDELLGHVRTHANLSDHDRLSVAPVVAGRFLRHLNSKIELSRQLTAGGIPTPDFRVAGTADEASDAANELGLPVMVKADAGHSGLRVRSATSITEVRRAATDLGGQPLLVQKWIAGQVVDTSAIFMNGEVIHATYSEELRRRDNWGPSTLRRYHPANSQRPPLLPTLGHLGAVLGLHGFANITAIDASDGSGLTFFEVDARPNAWVGKGSRVGDDPAVRLRHWWSTGESIASRSTSGRPQGAEVATYFRRRPRRDLLLSRYGVWRDFPTGNPDAWMLAGWTLLKGPG